MNRIWKDAAALVASSIDKKSTAKLAGRVVDRVATEHKRPEVRFLASLLAEALSNQPQGTQPIAAVTSQPTEAPGHTSNSTTASPHTPQTSPDLATAAAMHQSQMSQASAWADRAHPSW